MPLGSVRKLCVTESANSLFRKERICKREFSLFKFDAWNWLRLDMFGVLYLNNSSDLIGDFFSLNFINNRHVLVEFQSELSSYVEYSTQHSQGMV